MSAEARPGRGCRSVLATPAALENRLTPEVGAFILDRARVRALDYEAISAQAAERFPALDVPNAAQIATFVGSKLIGKSSQSRLAKDRELAAWLKDHKRDGRIEDIRAACIARFGIERVPSKQVVGAFLRDAGRTKRFDAVHLTSRDPEITAWVREHASTLDGAAIRTACMAKFGEARTPSRSRLWRLRRLLCPGSTRRHFRMESDPDVAAWLRENVATLSLPELRQGCSERFGAERTPSRAGLHRYLTHALGAGAVRKKMGLDCDPEVAKWAVANRPGRTLDGLLSDLIKVFGADRAPSRSGLHRYLAAARHDLAVQKRRK